MFTFLRMALLTDSPLRPPPAPPRPPARHAVVIGAGFGGLAAAIRLGAKGYRVTVLKKLDAPGGRASVFRQDGFTFDAGPSILTAPFLLEELWTLCGRRMEDDLTLKPVSPFYRIRFHDGTTFDATGDPDAMRSEVARLSPSDVAGYERFMRLSEHTCRIGFEQLGHLPFGSWTAMARVAPDLLRLGGYRSVYGLVSRFIKDERLRSALMKRQAKVRAAVGPAPDIRPRFQAMGEIVRPILLFGLGFVALKMAAFYFLLGGSDYLTPLDFGGLLFVLAAYAGWLVVATWRPARVSEPWGVGTAAAVPGE